MQATKFPWLVCKAYRRTMPGRAGLLVAHQLHLGHLFGQFQPKKKKSKIRNGINFLSTTALSNPFHNQILYFILGSTKTKLIEVSGKLPTYPSPKPTLALNSHSGENVYLGEG